MPHPVVAVLDFEAGQCVRERLYTVEPIATRRISLAMGRTGPLESRELGAVRS